MKHLIIISILLSINFVSNAQKKALLKDNEIKSITVYESKNGSNEDETIESFTLFDKKGNVIEEKEYSSDGKFKKHFIYEYDENSNKIKEIETDEDGKLLQTIIYKYDGDLKTEKIVYDNKNKIIHKKRYLYSKFN